MLGVGHWGDVIITEMTSEPKGEVMAIVESICKTVVCKCGVHIFGYPVHGMCYECAEEELTRLRRIEAALLNGQTHADAANRFRAVAREFVLRRDRAPLFAVADALEAK